MTAGGSSKAVSWASLASCGSEFPHFGPLLCPVRKANIPLAGYFVHGTVALRLDTAGKEGGRAMSGVPAASLLFHRTAPGGKATARRPNGSIDICYFAITERRGLARRKAPSIRCSGGQGAVGRLGNLIQINARPV